ncbi:SMC-Scp complex subunit ScpB [Candidatus Falkowbacteria bacterium]|jgi:segregation and condensation protein B|nr:SMC-Scp complex subunit ScpB [Candidatus Falkowbacteria bacterium]MBT4433415.1 SMC-Scp complex subunit ScpB [Candidatus Falkowbacteria bacterium]
MQNLKSKIESLLFVSGKSLSAGKIARFVEEEKSLVKKVLKELTEEYKNSNRGITIVKNLMSFEMTTSSENSEIVKEFLKDETSGELTGPSLETLTVIAYRGPISKPELEQIRGVNCSLILRNLTIRGLVVVKNKNDLEDKEKILLSNEKYYIITSEFLKFLGISSVEDLPDYEKLSQENFEN